MHTSDEAVLPGRFYGSRRNVSARCRAQQRTPGQYSGEAMRARCDGVRRSARGVCAEKRFDLAIEVGNAALQVAIATV